MKLPFDTRHINKEIYDIGDSVVIRNVTKLDQDDRGNAQLVLGDSKVSYTSGDDALLNFYNATWIAQTFAVGTSDIDVSSIKIKIKRTGTPSTITIGIRAVDEDSKPTGSDLTSGSLDYVDLIDDGDTEWIVLPLTSYTLSASTTYAIVIREASGDSSNKYEARIKTTGSYSGGNNLTSSDSGSTWTVGTSDILFDLYGDTDATAVVETLTESDDAVKNGHFQSGDKRIYFQNNEDVSRGTKIYHDSKWYEIDSIDKFSFGNTTYSIEAIAKKSSSNS